MALGEYAVKKAFLSDTNEMCLRLQEWTAQNTKNRRKCEQRANLDELRSKFKCATDGRRIEY